jgi:hypothetical protein
VGGPQGGCPALGKLLLDEDWSSRPAWRLTAIRDGAAEQFRAALPQATGKCRLNVVQGLGAVEDRQSADALRQAIGDSDREVRFAAGWGLSRMGDAGSVDALIKAADSRARLGTHPGYQALHGPGRKTLGGRQTGVGRENLQVSVGDPHRQLGEIHPRRGWQGARFRQLDSSGAERYPYGTINSLSRVSGRISN